MAESCIGIPLAADWRDDAVWVQDTILLRHLKTLPDGQCLLPKQTGEHVCLSAAALAEDYFCFSDDQVLKPAFRPVQAICLAHDVLVPTGDRLMHVRAGDAVVEQRDVTVHSLARERFNLAYRIVGHGAPNPPVGPFIAAPVGQLRSLGPTICNRTSE